ncbi:hypothetical protein HDU92_000480 [Lobulomyces angularis]|nr:hypothetical protein HDU92_000480 [Lobulomyces angularis]
MPANETESADRLKPFYSNQGHSVSTPNLLLSSSEVDTKTLEPVDNSTYPSSDVDSNSKLREDLEFHKLFPNIKLSDHLVTHYSCALAKDMLIQGRLWISDHHVCFRGWKDEPLQIPFYNITHIEKKSVAFVIPNAIEIETEHNKYFFASLLKRDDTFYILEKLWDKHVPKTSHFRKHPLNEGVVQCTCGGLGTCHACFKAYSSNNEFDSTNKNQTDVDNMIKVTDENGNPAAGSIILSVEKEQLLKDFSNVEITPILPISNFTEGGKLDQHGSNGLLVKSKEGDLVSVLSPTEDESMQSSLLSKKKKHHRKRRNRVSMNSKSCNCDLNEKERVLLLDKIYNTDLNTLFQLLYSNGENVNQVYTESFNGRIIVSRKNNNIQCSEWTPPEEKDSLVLKNAEETCYKIASLDQIKKGSIRKMEYITPISNPMANKTRCIIEETIHDLKEDHFVCIFTDTKTPDVPHGNYFSVSIKTHLTHAGPNKTRLCAAYKINWTKSSWLKSAIEKGVSGGVKTSYAELDEKIEEHLINSPLSMDEEDECSDDQAKAKEPATVKVKPSINRKSATQPLLERQPPVVKQPAVVAQLNPVLAEEKSNVLHTFFKELNNFGTSTFALILFVNLLLLMVFNIIIIWRVSLVLERYDERLDILQKLVFTKVLGKDFEGFK